MRLLLIRHAQTASNVAETLDSVVPGPPLTNTGIDQAAALARTLRSYAVDALYSSTHTRALQTAAPYAAETRLPVHVHTGLREVECGAYEGRSDPEAVNGYLDSINRWANGDLDHRMPDAISGEQALGRFDAVIREITTTTHQTVAVISHGGAIRGWVGHHARDMPDNFVTAYPLGNAGIAVLERISPTSRWQLCSWMGTSWSTQATG